LNCNFFFNWYFAYRNPLLICLLFRIFLSEVIFFIVTRVDFEDMSRVGLFKVRIHTDEFFGISRDNFELWCDPVGWSYNKILGILCDKGYPKNLSMYYRASGKFKVLENDEGAMEMITESIDNGIVDFYVLAKHAKCANVRGGSMNADVEVCESSKSDAHFDDIERMFLAIKERSGEKVCSSQKNTTSNNFDVDVPCENVNGDVYAGEMEESIDPFTKDMLFDLENEIGNMNGDFYAGEMEESIDPFTKDMLLDLENEIGNMNGDVYAGEMEESIDPFTKDMLFDLENEIGNMNGDVYAGEMEENIDPFTEDMMFDLENMSFDIENRIGNLEKVVRHLKEKKFGKKG